MNLLEIVQQATGELGLNQPTAVATTTDNQVKQLFALINGLGNDLVKVHTWQVLTKEHTFSTVSSDPDYSLPSDYFRMINQTEWDRTNRWELLGPKSEQEWQTLKSSNIASTTPFRFRIFNNLINVYPTPTSAISLAFEYIGKNWVLAVDGTTYKAKYTADTDSALFDDRLMITGLKLKFYEANGFDTAMLSRDFYLSLEAAKSYDKAAPKLSLTTSQIGGLTSPSVPDGNWSV